MHKHAWTCGLAAFVRTDRRSKTKHGKDNEQA